MFTQDPYANFELVYMQNGLPVYALYIPGLLSISLNVLLGVGARHDGKERIGISHYLEHMICANCGMKHNEMEELFANEGGGFTASTSWFTTKYGFRASLRSRKLLELINFWGAACFDNSLDEFMERERSIIMAEVKRRTNSEAQRAYQQSNREKRFGNTLYSWADSSLGRLETIESFTQEQVCSWRDEHYMLNKTAVVVVSGLETNSLLTLLNDSNLNRSFGGDATLSVVSVASKIPDFIQTESTIDLSVAGGQDVANVGMTFLLPGTISPYLCQVVAAIIGGEVWQKTREEKGLVYSAGASADSIHPFNQINIGASEVPRDSVQDVVRIIRTIIDGVHHKRTKFEQIKSAALFRFDLTEFTSGKILNQTVSELSKYGRIVTVHEDRADLESVHFNDIDSVLQYLTPENQLTNIVHR